MKKVKEATNIIFKEYKKIKIEQLVMADWNYKKFDDDDLQKKLVANIKKNGQIENIIVRELKDGFFEVTNGNHRYLAMKELGYTEVMCCNLGKISLTKAKRIAVETNETKFDTDDDKLAALLGEVVVAEDDFSDTNPFDEDEMKHFNNLMLDDEQEEVTQSPKKTTKTQTAVSLAGDKYTTVKIEATPDQAEQFTNLIKRFCNDENSEGTALSIVCKFMSKHSDKDVMKAVGIRAAKPVKKPVKSSAQPA